MKCVRCGNETVGTQNEGGITTAVCSNCDYHERQQRSRVYECIMCGEILGDCGKFCSDECLEEYRYENRRCDNCGGEFWDGGTSCTCED